MRLLKKALYAVAVLYVPLLLILPLSIDQTSYWFEVPYAWILLICLLITLPFYLAFLQICSLVSRLADKKQSSKGEKILNIICNTVALSVFLSGIGFGKFFWLPLSLAILLTTLWAIRFALFKKTFDFPEFFKQKSFWISVVALFASFVAFIAVYRAVSSDTAIYDDDIYVEHAAAELDDFEKIISKEHSLEGFDLIRLTVDTIDSPKHESSVLAMWYTDSSSEVRTAVFQISYSDFLTLYRENDGYVVYNDTEAEKYDTLVTKISPEAIFIVQKAIAREKATLK